MPRETIQLKVRHLVPRLHFVRDGYPETRIRRQQHEGPRAQDLERQLPANPFQLQQGTQ